jgi:nicotinamidase-related amidase
MNGDRGGGRAAKGRLGKAPAADPGNNFEATSFALLPAGGEDRMTGEDDDAGRITTCAPGGVGLLIIDMINDLGFEGGEKICEKAEDAGEVVLRLRSDADRLGTPVVYVNDNYGQWHSEKSKIVSACMAGDNPGRRLVERLKPRDSDYFVIKPQFSGFYSTNLPVLLPKLGVSRVVITGIAADICVLFTAADAHMRAYDIWTPRDAVVSEDDRRRDWAIDIMANSMGAETRAASELSLEEWLSAGGNAQ